MFRVHIKFVSSHQRNYYDLNNDEFQILFGTQLASFLEDDDCLVITPSVAKHMGITAYLNDKKSYSTCSSDPTWIIDMVWLSSGEGPEITGRYYGRGINERDGHEIDLYTLSFYGVKPPNIGSSSTNSGYDILNNEVRTRV